MGVEVHGVDTAPAMLEVAASRLSTATTPWQLRVGDARQLPVADGWADLAIAGWVFGHFHRVVPGDLASRVGAGAGRDAASGPAGRNPSCDRHPGHRGLPPRPHPRQPLPPITRHSRALALPAPCCEPTTASSRLRIPSSYSSGFLAWANGHSNTTV